MISQFFDNHGENNKTISCHTFCKINCFLREIEKLMMKETSQSLLSVKCSEKQQVARPCGKNETP